MMKLLRLAFQRRVLFKVVAAEDGDAQLVPNGVELKSERSGR